MVNQEESQESDLQSDQESAKACPILTNSITKWKGLTKTYSQPMVAPDLALDQDSRFNSFNANNVYEWNIDGKTEYNIMTMLQHMTMVCTAYQTAHNSSEEVIAK